MKTLNRFVLSGIIPLLIFLFQCNGDNGITDDDSETLSKQLIGGWVSTEQISEMLITVSTEQTIPDVYSEGTGSINITGAHNIELAYLFVNIEGGFTTAVVSNRPIIEGDKYPNHSLIFTDYFGGGFFANLIAKYSPDEMYVYENQDVNFNYDESTYSLTLDQTVLNNVDQTDSIFAEGVISSDPLNLPAGTPTSLFALNIEGNTVLIFERNGDYYGESTFEEDGEPVTETSTGSWNMIGDSLKIIGITENEGETLIDTVVFAVSITDGILKLWYEEIEVDQSYLDGFELSLGLEPGTLEEIRYAVTFTFSKGISKRGSDRSVYDLWPDGRRIVKILEESVNKYRKINR